MEEVQTDLHTCVVVIEFATALVGIVIVGQLGRFVAAGVAVHIRQMDVAQVIIAPVVGVIRGRFYHIRCMIQLRLIIILKKHSFLISSFDWVKRYGITFGMVLWDDFEPFLAASPAICNGVSCLSAVNDDSEKMESLAFEKWATKLIKTNWVASKADFNAVNSLVQI